MFYNLYIIEFIYNIIILYNNIVYYNFMNTNKTLFLYIKKDKNLIYLIT